ncbi:adenosylhomocysteinase [Desulfitibacter alkalitolerans]|uniref:adenosylhomocysteinase n=1 Tax=Desulfitibacter alkalitolerans TaxID=264641 RepID=UPI000556FD42|nr:adenosylhomocysteinase [Desulfitibacter alkalitolerans]
MKESMIRDLKLAPQGVKKLQWVRKHMPILNQLESEFRVKQYFKGRRVVICLHLEAKTGYLAQVIKAGGAEVTVVASNPLSTQDDVVAALVQDGIRAYAWHGAADQEYYMHLNAALDFKPDLIIDDGGDLVALLHKERLDQLKEIIGGCEETTTGILRLKVMSRENQLKFPMMAVNDAYCKYLFDNRYGTGQSVWDGINRTTNLVVAGKNVVVVGYGWCGKGVAMRAKGLGAKVIVTEVDPIKAIEAHMDGFRVMPMQEAASIGNFFITVTGNCNVIRKEHFLEMNDGAILANAGHFDIEISKGDLLEVSSEKRDVRPNVEQYILNNGKSVYLLAEGRLVNLAAGDGHPAEIMDLTFALQALCLQYVMQKKDELEPGVYPVPEDIDKRVANLGLSTLGINIDCLTNEQIRYLDSWHV